MIHVMYLYTWVTAYVCVCVCALLESWSWWQDVEQEFIDAVKWLEGKGVSGITGISAESFRGMWDDMGRCGSHI